MEKPAASICAAIDIGSNTIHIVVARCSPQHLDILADKVDMVRIGESVTASGEISPEKIRATLSTLAEYQALAHDLNAEHIFVVATEAIRQARNNHEFIAQIKQETNLDVLLISGTVEANLTFTGATYEVDKPSHIAVMDLGGGSLELVFAQDMQISWRTSVPLGSGWLHDRYLTANPPDSTMIEVAETFLQTYFDEISLPTPISLQTPLLVATGGSANSLLHLAQRAFHYHEHQKLLSSEDLVRCQHLLTALQSEDISHLYEQDPVRARILLAGALIIHHVMQRLSVPHIHVSPHGIREGILLFFALHGTQWLTYAEQEPQTEKPPETFSQSASTMLMDRTHKMLSLTNDVLKHEDVEAVHKMRVASRRLRATMDAYESCCEPQTFKKAYHTVKDVADSLGDARDTDVMISTLDAQLETLSRTEQQGVTWLISHLQHYRSKKQQDLEDVLLSLDKEKLRRTIKRSLDEGMDT